MKKQNSKNFGNLTIYYDNFTLSKKILIKFKKTVDISLKVWYYWLCEKAQGSRFVQYTWGISWFRQVYEHYTYIQGDTLSYEIVNLKLNANDTSYAQAAA